jgi:hypothetical protein
MQAPIFPDSSHALDGSSKTVGLARTLLQSIYEEVRKPPNNKHEIS